MSLFKDQTVWITGASSGIGAALARCFHDEGAKLILSGRREAQLKETAQACGGAAACLILPFEATDHDALPDVVASAKAWTGRIDVLVNNAGISQRSWAENTSLEVYRRLIEVNLTAPIALTQSVLPLMLDQGGGRIIVISSVAGKIGAPLRSGYSAAKHGVFGYFDALRAETDRRGIQVHMVAPGSVKTDVSRNALSGDGSARGVSDDFIENAMSADQAARRMIAGVKRGKREILVAEGREALAYHVRRLWPEKAFDMISKAVAKGYANAIDAPRYKRD